MRKFMNLYEEVSEINEDLGIELAKLEDGNKSACIRARKLCQNIINMYKEIRTSSLDFKKELTQINIKKKKARKKRKRL